MVNERLRRRGSSLFSEAAATARPADPLEELEQSGKPPATARVAPTDEVAPAQARAISRPRTATEESGGSEGPEARPERDLVHRGATPVHRPQRGPGAGRDARGRRTSVQLPHVVWQAAVEQYRTRRVSVSELLADALDDADVVLTEPTLAAFRGRREQGQFVPRVVKINLAVEDLARLDLAGERVRSSRSEAVSLLLAAHLRVDEVGF